MDEIKLNSLVKYEARNDSLQLGMNTTLNWDWHRTYPETIVEKHYHYPTYPAPNISVVYEDRYKKAFMLAKKLLKEKRLVSRKLSDFLELVEIIVGEI